jgi:hypothetical protein
MPNDAVVRGIWLAIACLASLFVAAGAGLLTRWTGAPPAKSVITAGTAFAGTLLLTLAVLSYVGPA